MAPRNLNIFGTGTGAVSKARRRLSTSSSLMPRKPKPGSVFAAVRLGFYCTSLPFPHPTVASVHTYFWSGADGSFSLFFYSRDLGVHCGLPRNRGAL